METKSPIRLEVDLSARAKRQLESRSAPLTVYLELLFSCMIRKRVLFPDHIHPDALEIGTEQKNLSIWFRAVGTKTCLISDQPVPDLQTFPIRRVTPFLPRKLKLDFKGGHWWGEFGYR